MNEYEYEKHIGSSYSSVLCMCHSFIIIIIIEEDENDK